VEINGTKVILREKLIQASDIKATPPLSLLGRGTENDPAILRRRGSNEAGVTLIHA
jgi:hypothetical protein